MLELGERCVYISSIVTEQILQRQGVLAIVNLVYEPLGFVPAAILKGRILLRKLVAMGNQKCTREPSLGWDDPLSESLSREWQCWRDSLIN